MQLPNLDDRNYDDLVKEAISLIPRYAPSWTNYNASDPGITLIELLAYITEMLIFRLDRIGREHKINFLRLLQGFDRVDADELQHCSLEDIERRIQQAVVDLKEPQRAVTGKDYEILAVQALQGACGERIDFRVLCVMGKNLELTERGKDRDCPGHVSLIVVADRNLLTVAYEQLLQDLRDDLEPKRLLTTRLHVVGPTYLWMALKVSLKPRPDTAWEIVKQTAQDRLNRFFSPFAGGGPDNRGWRFGRNVYLSEVYDVLEQIPEVDYIDCVIVQRLSFTEDGLESDQAVIGTQIGLFSTVGRDTRIGSKFCDSERIITDGAGQMAGIRLKTYELVKIVVRDQDIEQVGEAAQSGKGTGET